jgi:hypothetical protein
MRRLPTLVLVLLLIAALARLVRALREPDPDRDVLVR